MYMMGRRVFVKTKKRHLDNNGPLDKLVKYTAGIDGAAERVEDPGCCWGL